MDSHLQSVLIAFAGVLITGIAARFFVPLLPPSEPIEDEPDAASKTAAE